MRIKILSALAMGKSIVSTSIGCEGIDVTPGRETLVADTREPLPARFWACWGMKMREGVWESGWLELVKAKYQCEPLVKRMEGEYLRIVKGHRHCHEKIRKR